MHKRNIIGWWLRLKNRLCSICINLPWRDFAIYWWVHGKVFMRISIGIPYGNKIARLIMMVLLRQWHLAYPNSLWIQKCIIIQCYANCRRCSKSKAQLFIYFHNVVDTNISFDFTKAEINYGKEVATLCGICRGTKNALWSSQRCVRYILLFFAFLRVYH